MKTLIKKTAIIAMLLPALFACKKSNDVTVKKQQTETVSNSTASCTNTLFCTPNKAAMVQVDSFTVSTQYDNTNYANYFAFKAERWFFNVHTFTSRSLIKFNLPQNFFNGFTFCKAELVLRENPDANFFPSNPYTVFQSMNTARIVRIKSTWSQNTVTWNTQPLTTNANSAFVPAIGTGTSYTSPDNQTINITALMHDVQNLGVDRGIEIFIPSYITSSAARQFGSKYPTVSNAQAQLVFHY